jgi:hypothetical protein
LLSHFLLRMMDAHNRFFPFSRLGLTRNPFGSLTNAERQATLVLPPDLFERVGNHQRVQIMGERGRGKTMLLFALCRHYEQHGERILYEGLPEGKKRYRATRTQMDSFALDEAQRLDWWGRQQFGSLLPFLKHTIIGTHHDMAGLLGRDGQPVLTLQAAEFMSEAHLATVLARRVSYFAERETYTTLAPDAVAYLAATFGDDVRAMEMRLYEVFQQCVRLDHTPDQITIAMLEAKLH